MLMFLLILSLAVQCWNFVFDESASMLPAQRKQEDDAYAQRIASTDCNVTADDQHFRGLSIVGAFNHIVDLHMRNNHTQIATLKYIKGWYDSIQNFPDIQGVVLTTMYDQEFIANHSRSNVKFHTVDPTSPSSLRGQNKSINDQRFYMIQDYLQNVRASDAEYILLSDAQDVRLFRNPFEFMRTMDTLLGEHQIYIQAEYEAWRAGIRWQGNQWRSCFDEKFAYRRFLGAGLVGGHRDVVIGFLDLVVQGLDNVREGAKICDQSVIQKLAHETYGENIISGYPFNSRFKSFQTEKDTLAYIAHK